MLSIAAIGIVAAFVIPFIKSNLNQSTECLNYKSYFTFQEVFNYGTDSFRYNCRDSVDGLYGVSIKAASDATLVKNVIGFNVVFAGNGPSKAIRIDNGISVGGVHMMGSKADTVLGIPGAGEVKSYVYSSGESYTKMEVYPVLKSGRICDMSDSIEIINCDSNVVKAGAIE
jgi:hypothetical protein